MAESKLFKRLERLFSTDVVIRNVGGNQIKTLDVNKIQQSGDIVTNALVDRFRKAYTNSSTSLYGQMQNQNFQALRPQLYSEYDIMDYDAIVASSLDIMADEATLKNDMGEVLQIKSSDEGVQKILYNLFYDVLNVEFNLWPWVRNLCKYGDFFLKLEISEKFGVYNILPYTAYHMERIEGMDEENPNDVKFRYDRDGISMSGYGNVMPTLQNTNKNDIILDNYEVAHFRLLSDMNLVPYGRSMLEPARKIFKSYVLLEDAMMIHRIVRAPEKRMFYLNIGNIPPSEVEGYMEKTISNLKRTPHIDEQTGEYNLKYNLQNLLEDYYIPVRGNDTSTKIENVNGLQWDSIADVEYYRDKLFAALKVPKAFMGYTADLEGKATLAAQDIRFARTIERIQRIITSEFYKIALIHLYSQGYRNEQLTNFELSLTTPSIIYEQEKINLLKEKVDLANSLKDSKLLPTDWIYNTIFQLSEENYDEYRDLIAEDAKREFRLKQIESEGNDPQQTGQSYGTPHDLACLDGKGRYQDNSEDVPPGYDEDEKVPLGRPKEKASNTNTQDNPFGKDRLGKEGRKGDLTPSKPSVNLESKSHYNKHEGLLKDLPNKKHIIFEQNSSPLLDESNLNDEEF